MKPSADVFSQQALEIQEALDRLEQYDWARWLIEADAATTRISDLYRQAAEAERYASSQSKKSPRPPQSAGSLAQEQPHAGS